MVKTNLRQEEAAQPIDTFGGVRAELTCPLSPTCRIPTIHHTKVRYEKKSVHVIYLGLSQCSSACDFHETASTSGCSDR